MIDSFQEVSIKNNSPIASAIGEFSSDFCDFTPYVIQTWQEYYNTHFAKTQNALYLRHTINGRDSYACLGNNIVKNVEELFQMLGKSSMPMTLLTGAQVNELKKHYSVSELATDEAWSDYIYLHSDLAEMSGKRYAGQRNHINKFISNCTSWSYEKIDSSNLQEVYDFYLALSRDTTGFDDTALYEMEHLVRDFFTIFDNHALTGGLIRADSRIVSFAIGEVLNDTLFVHVEKALKSVQGAYQIIVREFARHNLATYINREEDMGIEGLRISKRSYHPCRMAEKFVCTVGVEQK